METSNVPATPQGNPVPSERPSWRNNKRVRLGLLIALIVIAGIIAFFFEKTRLWMFSLIALLLVGLGLEATNTDYDIGKMIETKSMSQSKVLRDKEGNVVPAGTAGAKGTDEYNCSDFATRSEAQRFFLNAGGVAGDTNRLDGNKDGEACESLPGGKP
jgi:hypothetical protein